MLYFKYNMNINILKQPYKVIKLLNQILIGIIIDIIYSLIFAYTFFCMLDNDRTLLIFIAYDSLYL